MRSIHRLLLLLIYLLPLLATTCKKDYYSGTEHIRLNATLNNTNEVIRLGDTLKINFVLPPTLASESGVVTPVNSVQQALYNFTLYRLDTVDNRVTRIVSPSALVVSRGSFYAGSTSSVTVSTVGPPYRSVLNLIPAARGVYYVQTIKGALTVNGGSYQAFLAVNLDVPDKHWALPARYIPGYSTAPEILAAEAEGFGPYWFRVK